MRTQHVSVRFLIGLSSPLDPIDPGARAVLAKERRARATELLPRAYDVGAFYYGAGVWKGSGEPCMSFETIQPYTGCMSREDVARRARGIARELAAELSQDAIGLVFSNVELELIAQ